MSKFYEKNYVKWRYDEDQKLRQQGLKEGMGVGAPIIIAAASFGFLGLKAWSGIRNVFKKAATDSSVVIQKNNS